MRGFVYCLVWNSCVQFSVHRLCSMQYMHHKQMRVTVERPEAGVIKKLSLAGLAKLSRQRYS
jgi:hypothetical protein